MARVAYAAVAVACGVLAISCGGGVEGEYVGKKGESFFDSLNFRSGGKVDVVMIGIRHEGTFEADGDQVTITAPNGERTPLTLDSSGCLTHPIAGTYCKGGSGTSSAATSTPSPSGAEVYEARAREGQITIEFGAARTARITMVPAGIADAPERLSFDVSYVAEGDRVTVSLPGNEPLMLTRIGRDLEGSMNGESVRFVKR